MKTSKILLKGIKAANVCVCVIANQSQRNQKDASLFVRGHTHTGGL